MQATAEQLRAFGDALAIQLTGADRGALLEQLGVSRAALQQWLAGTHEAKRAKVFLLEEILDLRPGSLSKHLGYLPLDARPVVTVEDAIANDTRLTKRDRQLLIDLYRSRLES